MGLYSRYIFPRLIDATLSSKQIQRIRESVLANVQGDVFEIGFGTGLNLPHYPSNVKRITTVDPNPGTRRLAERRIAKSTIEVVQRTLSRESLPLENDSFDSVVSTFTLCSVNFLWPFLFRGKGQERVTRNTVLKSDVTRTDEKHAARDG